jgi:hypothetical protein
LCDAHAAPLCLLALLAALQPVRNPRRDAQQPQPPPATQATSSSSNLLCLASLPAHLRAAAAAIGLRRGSAAANGVAAWAEALQRSPALPPPSPAGDPAGLPHRPPYVGYRGDVLAALGHLMHGRPAAAEAIAAVDGAVPLLLSQVALLALFGPF